jgi:hypothetical protein
MCGLSQIKCPNQQGSISFTFFGLCLRFVVGHEMYSLWMVIAVITRLKCLKKTKTKQQFCYLLTSLGYNNLLFLKIFYKCYFMIYLILF